MKYLLIALILCFPLTSYSANKDVTVCLDYVLEAPLAGFKVYQNGTIKCTVPLEDVRVATMAECSIVPAPEYQTLIFTCNVERFKPVANWTATAFDTNDIESEHSGTYTYIVRPWIYKIFR